MEGKCSRNRSRMEKNWLSLNDEGTGRGGDSTKKPWTRLRYSLSPVLVPLSQRVGVEQQVFLTSLWHMQGLFFLRPCLVRK